MAAGQTCNHSHRDRTDEADGWVSVRPQHCRRAGLFPPQMASPYEDQGGAGLPEAVLSGRGQ